MGLSPHAWGNRSSSSSSVIRIGSIPTRVGEPRATTGCRRTSRVYPHTRGGTNWRTKIDQGSRGLSPHAWGNPSVVLPGGTAERSIPTRVGEPSSSTSSSRRFTVYPHTRGGTTQASPYSGKMRGLSPHAWGNLKCPRTRILIAGSIPTRVGEP